MHWYAVPQENMMEALELENVPVPDTACGFGGKLNRSRLTPETARKNQLDVGYIQQSTRART